MTDREALLAAVAANPDDDTPRLVLADWLDEHGEGDFATFVRTQVEKERFPHGHPDRVRCELREEKVRAGAPPEFLRLPFPAETRRGFVSAVTVGVKEYLGHAAALAPYAPRVAVALVPRRDDPFDPNDDPDNPVAARPTQEQRDAWEDAAFTRLVACPHLTTWDELDLTELHVGPLAFRRLTACPHLRGLAALDVSGCPGGAAVAAVACANLSGLRRLDVSNTHERRTMNPPGDGGFAALVTSPHLARLERLDFAGNGVTSAGCLVLARSPHMSALESLDLSHNPVGDAGLRALASATRLRKLTALDVSGYPAATADGCGAFAQSVVFARLAELDISTDGGGMAALARSDHAAGLRRLAVHYSGWPLTGHALREVIESPHLRGLRGFHLYGCELDPQTAAALARPDVLPALERLSVQVHNNSPAHLAAVAALRQRFGDRATIEDDRIPF